ncbi:hypothetical protein Tco_1420451 [Tanacetum coccineum]
MLAPRSAKALQEKVLLKLHGIRKLSRSSSLGGTLFWIIAELSSLKKAAEIYCDHGSFGAFPSHEANHRFRKVNRFSVKKSSDISEEISQKELGKETATEIVKWLPLIANSLAVSGIVIAEPGVGATTWSATYIDRGCILGEREACGVEMVYRTEMDSEDGCFEDKISSSII